MGDTVHGNKNVLSGEFPNAIINIDSIIQLPSTSPPYVPPSWPAPNELPDPTSPPPSSRLLFQPNPLFTGRKTDLLEFAALLRTEQSAPPPVVIATGIGGVGKTQLATEFAYRYGCFYAGGVQWVTLDGDEATIESQIVDCGAAMGLYDAADMTLTPEQKAARVREAWRGPTPCLLYTSDAADE